MIDPNNQSYVTIRTSLRFVYLLLMAGVVDTFHRQALCAESPRAKAEAPPDQAIVGAKLGGKYFAPKPLKEKYDRLISSVRALEVEIAEGRISGQQAVREVNQLRDDLADVQKAIEAQKKFVPVAKIHTKSDSTTFDLGSDHRLLILANKVRIIGWDEPQVKCVLDKTILTAGDESVDSGFEQMQLVHEHRMANEEVGKAAEELEAAEARFLETPEGKELTPKQLELRRQILEGNKRLHRLYRPLQGKQVDVISVQGVSYEEGNRQITLEVRSPNGEGSMSNDWQRHAMLTVYVPVCEAIAVKGGSGGLEVESVKSQLIVRGNGNRDYQGQFRIHDLKGSLTAEQIPLQIIDDVSGDVDVTMTAYLGNSGNRHADDTRTSYVFLPEPYVYKNLQGGFRGRFVRADLQLRAIDGQVDVENEYGKTVLVAEKPLSPKAHRLISNGGQIEIQLAKDTLGDLPVLAISECGTVRLGFQDRSFQDVSWSGPLGNTGDLRGWRGFERKSPAANSDTFFERFDRVAQIVAGEDRTPGLDLISRGGSIQIMRAK